MIYDFKVKAVRGREVSMEDYKGKVLLIVNTATGCGFTPQYEGLQKLYDKYKDNGFEILDFPCNQFLEQAPGSDEEIVSFCQLKYRTTFKTFSKIDVNGENASDLYKYLREQAPKAAEDEASEGLYDKLKGLGFSTDGDEIKWNFTKFLIDKEGNVIERFAPTYEPEKIAEKIEELLKK
ncbi:glutathione peroxidase [Clostridium saccharoperbutylacetonicum]|uniref:glutathione peroxidase n=1 Tax=Clostridium saccharoperbutylacetonicum TaxID=36745 RepID=UPI000983DF33|nr:glutathione peroxidase [Clostridium saccharoperbutylacetonicum]AQR93756.1 hydroperoxy fatty acid reductase gpx1 [Clostridium saccharoperbutylacetonicum]NSB29456.1 glutathione peroxidase [Clostridium saccharoperbutylacetonicum]